MSHASKILGTPRHIISYLDYYLINNTYIFFLWGKVFVVCHQIKKGMYICLQW